VVSFVPVLLVSPDPQPLLEPGSYPAALGVPFLGSDPAELLRTGGLLVLFVLFVLEGAMLLYFVPSESLVPAAVVVLANETVLGVLGVISIAVVGATIGQCLLFALSERVGRERILAWRFSPVSETRFDQLEGFFERWGALAIPLSNTLLFTRGMLTVPAGLSQMGRWRFLAYSALGTAVFETILAALTLGLLEGAL